MSPLRSEVRYGSYLAYHPRYKGGTSPAAKQSHIVMPAVKQWYPDKMKNVLDHVARNYQRYELDAFFGPDVALVPAPGSAPLRVADQLWVPRNICNELCDRGLGAEVPIALERIQRVQKSALAAPGQRPYANEHYETIQAHTGLVSAGRLTVVDDFITRGDTLAACVSVLEDAYPGCDVQAFALVRTRGLVDDISQVVDPVSDGTIKVVGGMATRSHD